MKAYRLRLRPRSAWATPWHADTLWGSLCWAWHEVAAKPDLESLLQRFDAGPPPFVLSAAFPADLLPFPVGVQPAGIDLNKKFKPEWCRTSDFIAWSENTSAPLPAAPAALFVTHSLLHAQRSRNTDSTEGGELFEVDQHTFDPTALTEHDRYFSVYLRAEPEMLPPFDSAWKL